MSTTPTLSATEASTREAYGRALVELGSRNSDVVVLTADLMHSTMVEPFALAYPERFFNCGIAEQNMVGMAAGLATCGKVVFASTFACFASMRSCEQVRTDVAYPRLNVKIVGTHSGVSMGAGGTTHHSLEDVGIFRSMPNMTVVVPMGAGETRKAVHAAADYDGPVYIRLGRDPEPVVHPTADVDFRIGEAAVLAEGADAVAISMGSSNWECLRARDILLREGLSLGILNVHTVKPLDVEAITAALTRVQAVVTVEEHNVRCGLGSAVAEAVAGSLRIPFRALGIPDVFADIGSAADLRRKYGLTAEGIAEAVRELLGVRM